MILYILPDLYSPRDLKNPFFKQSIFSSAQLLFFNQNLFCMFFPFKLMFLGHYIMFIILIFFSSLFFGLIQML